jgi:hypothetical protein
MLNTKLGLPHGYGYDGVGCDANVYRSLGRGPNGLGGGHYCYHYTYHGDMMTVYFGVTGNGSGSSFFSNRLGGAYNNVGGTTRS